MNFTLRVAGAETDLRAYHTPVPGLVCVHLASGWYVGHIPSGGLVHPWKPFAKREQAYAFAEEIRDICEWTREIAPDARAEVTEEVNARYNALFETTPWTPCEDRGAKGTEGPCLVGANHSGAHAANGKTWRRE